MRQVAVTVSGRHYGLHELTAPLVLDRLVPGDGKWEVEIGFGKGRYLIRRAVEAPQRRFLGIEMASAYHRLVARRAERRGADNLMLIRGEALYVLATLVPAGFASAVHVYFPDPWPKARHQKRRLFDPETVDLVLDLLQPGGRLYFATDFLEYGQSVEALLDSHPATEVRSLDGPWPDGARTNYEAKYQREERPIQRLEVRWHPAREVRLHPGGQRRVMAAVYAGAEDKESPE